MSRHGRFFSFQNNKEKRSSIKSFFKLIKQFDVSPWVWVISILFGAFIAGSMTTASWFLGYIVDKFFNNSKFFEPKLFDYKLYFTLVGLLGLVYLLQKVLLVIQRFLLSRASLMIGSKIRHAVYLKLQLMSLSFYEEVQTGNLMSSITNDVSNLVQGMTDMIGNSITVSFTLILIVSVMIYYSPIIALIALIVIPVNFIPIFIIINKNQKYYIEYQERLGEFNAFLEEILDAFPLVNIHQRQQYVAQLFQKYNKNLLIPNLKAATRQVLMYPWLNFAKVLNLIEVVGITIILKTYWTGMPHAERITAGVIITLSIYIYSISDSFNQILEIITSLQTGLSSALRLNRIIELRPKVDETKLNELNIGNGEIEFKNVWFAYPSNPEQYVLKDISFKIKKGETLALVGNTGCGKTTIAKLLSKLYLPSKGDIMINNQSVFDIKETSWRNNLDIILQETFILKDTIKNNLTCVNEKTDKTKLLEITKITGVDDFVQHLPLKYDTILTNNGSNLSEGQKQLLAITRSIISNRPITILDEATSNMDTLTENKIQNSINYLAKNKTMLAIAHRLSTVRNANKILVIDKGEILERGNHKTLLDKKGFYYKLYHAGFEE